MNENFEEREGAQAPEKLTEERGMPSVNSRKSGNKIGKIAGLSALAVIVAGMIWINVIPKDKPKEPEAETTEIRRALPPLVLKEDPQPTPATAAPEQAATPQPGTPAPVQVQPAQPTEADLLLERRKRAPILAFEGGALQATSNAGERTTSQDGMQFGQAGFGNGAAGAGSGGPPTSLGAALKPSGTDMSVAGTLPDRNFLITKGTFLDCALITAIDSTLPGMTSCRLTRNIYSDNGRVLLLERGSIIEGEYSGGQMRQGMKRIFVLWTRVRTPKGVFVQLDSPGTDELGRSGLPGWVDTHFWQRFGGALLFSLVDAGAEYAVAKAKSGDGDNISFDGSRDAATDAVGIALQNSINIPPTLNKNQGDLINVYVARDLDFRRVYELRPR